MKKIILLLLIISLIIMYGCSIFEAKSGKKYNKQILSELHTLYNEDFNIVSQIGENSDGYQVLVVSPNDNSKIKFKVQFYTRQDNAGLTPKKKLYDDYGDSSFMVYASPLYKKYFNININEEEITKINKLDSSVDFNLSNPYSIKNINEKNMKETAKSIVNIFETLKKNKPFNKNPSTQKYAIIPFSFSVDSNDYSTFFSMEEIENDHAKNIEIVYNKLKRIEDRLKNNKDN